MHALHRTFCHALLVLIITGSVFGQTKTETSQVKSIPYLKLTEPRHVMPDSATLGGRRVSSHAERSRTQARRIPLLGMVRAERRKRDWACPKQ